MAARKRKNLYYYASGKRVRLEPADDLVAVDEARVAEKLPDLLASEPALRSGIPLRGAFACFTGTTSMRSLSAVYKVPG